MRGSRLGLLDPVPKHSRRGNAIVLARLEERWGHITVVKRSEYGLANLFDGLDLVGVEVVTPRSWAGLAIEAVLTFLHLDRVPVMGRDSCFLRSAIRDEVELGAETREHVHGVSPQILVADQCSRPT